MVTGTDHDVGYIMVTGIQVHVTVAFKRKEVAEEKH
jgi:hypothetical protein